MVSELVCCVHLKKRSWFGIRLILPALYCVFLGFNPISGALGTAGIIGALYDVLPFLNVYYLVMLVLSTAILRFCFDEKLLTLSFYTMTAFIVEHFCSHAMQLFAYAIQGHHVTIPTVSRVFEILLLVGILLLIRFVWIRNMGQAEVNHKSIVFFVAIAMVLMSAFSSLVYYLSYVTPITHIYELFISLLLVIIQYGFISLSRKDTEKAVMERTLKEQAKQQMLYNENIAFINARCHDLKSQIQVLSMVQTEEERQQSVAELEQALLLQDTSVKTGGQVLDVVLMEKHLLCQKDGITLSCMVDGAACGFMEAADICMLFGNALNNAIEAAGKCEEDKRHISLTVRQDGSLVRILVENYYEGMRNRAGEDFVTTKANDSFEHGFGLKRMRSPVQIWIAAPRNS